MNESLDALSLNFAGGGLLVLSISLALVMYGVALHLRFEDFRRIGQQPRSALTGLSAQFIFLPAMSMGLIWLWQPQPSIALGLLLVACCPGGNMSNFISLVGRANVALSVSLTAASSVLALVLSPLNFQVWQQFLPRHQGQVHSIDVPPEQIGLSLALMLVLPLFLGMFTAARWPDLAARLRRPFGRLSMIIFTLILVLAIGANLGAFLKWWPYIALLVIVHNSLAFSGGYLMSRMASLPVRDMRSVTIETGIQNSALALVLIFAHFDGLGGMALTAAFWGVWHLISGLLLARVFAWQDRRAASAA